MPTDRRPRRSRHAARLALALLAVALVACGGTTPPPLATSTTLAMD